MTEPLDDSEARPDSPPFDTAALARYLATRIEGFPTDISVEKFKGGQSNPTYLLTAGDARYVLRKKPDGVLMPSAHAVEREFRVISALRDSGVPAPRAECLCEDRSIIGTPFYVMAFVDGRIYWDPTLPGLSPGERAAHYDEINRTIARLHAIAPNSVGLGDFGRSGAYMQRQVSRWSRQYLTTQTRRIEAMDKLIDWLPRHLPASEAFGIVHGDLRVDNMIFHSTEPRVVALLDWELSTLGDPLADFAYHMLTWRLKADEFRGMAQADLGALGIPGEADYRARYFARVGREPPSDATWEYYLIYNAFRLAAILQGIAKRVEEGTAASESARETGAKASIIAEIGWRWARERLAA